MWRGSSHWEHGSYFHLADPASEAPPNWIAKGTLWQTGRAGLLAILEREKAVSGSRRVWIPSYYCESVVPALRSAGLEILRYDCTPQDRAVELGAGQREGDVVVAAAYFGLSKGAVEVADLLAGAILVEDHTHDPASEGARDSAARWCFASLRKTLPLPDGGVTWSPMAAPRLESGPTDDADARCVSTRLAAMALKRSFLAGAPIEKEEFRLLFASSEDALEVGRKVAASGWTRAAIYLCAWEAWRNRRKENHAILERELFDLQGIQILSQASSGSAPAVFSFLLSQPEWRSPIVDRLVASQVYPIQLWQLPSNALPRAKAVSVRHMAVQCDQRYDAHDMHRVAATVREALTVVQ